MVLWANYHASCLSHRNIPISMMTCGTGIVVILAVMTMTTNTNMIVILKMLTMYGFVSPAAAQQYVKHETSGNQQRSLDENSNYKYN